MSKVWEDIEMTEEEEDIDSLIEMERERQYERIQRSIETCGDA
jgi:hypothetical protein